jgi:hypothetical protein
MLGCWAEEVRIASRLEGASGAVDFAVTDFIET